MTNEQILKKAIEKAVKGGWDGDGWYEDWGRDEIGKILFNYKNSWDVEKLIFSHDFAKAFFPKVSHDNDNDVPWQFNLQQMVLEKDPIKYLERFL